MLFLRTIQTEITIHANIQNVWKVLEDFDNYHQWNDFCPKIETTKEIGTPFIMTVYMKPGKKPIIQKEVFSDYDPPRTVGWSLDWGMFLKTHRIQTLTEADKNTTHYYTHDKFWGLLSPLVMLLYKNDIQRGFELVAKKLKAVCELNRSNNS